MLGSSGIEEKKDEKADDSVTGDKDVSEALSKVTTGVDLDIKTTLSKSLTYQVGSQGHSLQRRRTFMAEEAELAAEVTSAIEAREAEVLKLRIESENVQQQYVTASETRLGDMDIDDVMGDLLIQMRKVREATLRVCETYGAWARLLHREKAKKEGGVYNPEGNSAAKKRTFCVNIAQRGPMIYPQSKEMKSTISSKFGRSTEKAKYSIDVKYIGEFTNRDEASAAFSRAMSNIPSNQVLPADMDGSKVLIGLRKCGKHYLVRSSSVPQDIPCEACGAAKLAKPSLVVKDPFPKDENEIFHQFIWHGQNYLERMWIDTDFLQQSHLLNIVFPDLHLYYNPLMLPHRSDPEEVFAAVPEVRFEQPRKVSLVIVSFGRSFVLLFVCPSATVRSPVHRPCFFVRSFIYFT